MYLVPSKYPNPPRDRALQAASGMRGTLHHSPPPAVNTPFPAFNHGLAVYLSRVCLRVVKTGWRHAHAHMPNSHCPIAHPSHSYHTLPPSSASSSSTSFTFSGLLALPSRLTSALSAVSYPFLPFVCH